MSRLRLIKAIVDEMFASNKKLLQGIDEIYISNRSLDYSLNLSIPGCKANGILGASSNDMKII